jgi:hypothetical protein
MNGKLASHRESAGTRSKIGLQREDMITTLQTIRLVAFGLVIVMLAWSQVSSDPNLTTDRNISQEQKHEPGIGRESVLAQVPSEQASRRVPAISPRAPLKAVWTSSHCIHLAPAPPSAKVL